MCKDTECYTKSLFIVQDYRLYIAGANNSVSRCDVSRNVYPNYVYKVLKDAFLTCNLHKKPYYKIILEWRVQFSLYLCHELNWQGFCQILQLTKRRETDLTVSANALSIYRLCSGWKCTRVQGET